MILEYFKDGYLNVIVKPNAPKTEIILWDEGKKALRIAVAAVPDKNKANRKLLKFLEKQTGKRLSISKGLKSREKTIKITE
ncbi:MAG: DUF167 domain-containing protein [Candidatus Nanoarchaeia archaeon]